MVVLEVAEAGHVGAREDPQLEGAPGRVRDKGHELLVLAYEAGRLSLLLPEDVAVDAPPFPGKVVLRSL